MQSSGTDRTLATSPADRDRGLAGPDWPPPLPTALGPADVVVARATGDDRIDYLDAVLSQRLAAVAPGTATAALELGPNGEPNGVLDLAVLADEVVLLVPSVVAEGVVSRLAGRTFLSDVVVAVDEGARVERLRGPAARSAAAAAGLPTPRGTATVDDGVLRLGDAHGVLIVGPPASLAAVGERLVATGEVATADAATLDALELVAGRPRPPEEVTRGRLPEELGLLPTHVHLAKGCYPGQEAVARMWQLGRPRRRLAVLEGAAGLAPGRLEGGDRPVEVTRVATVAGRHVGLGFVHRDATVGEEVAPGVVVRGLVGEGEAVPGHDPAVARRRDRR